MKSNKRYTNTTITKRVDHLTGDQRPALSEPLVCADCGAVYSGRRWSVAEAPRKNVLQKNWHPAEATRCPACKQQQEGIPGGFVYLEGGFLTAHREEIERLLRNEAERAAVNNPLARIMQMMKEETGAEGRLTVTTTTENLAQRLGRALERAFDGEVRYDFSHENKLARVYWRRD